jgi:hypothetical protein
MPKLRLSVDDEQLTMTHGLPTALAKSLTVSVFPEAIGPNRLPPIYYTDDFTHVNFKLYNTWFRCIATFEYIQSRQQ